MKDIINDLIAEQSLVDTLLDGLTEEQSKVLAAQSMIGAGRMVLESGMTTEQLIDGVCSPGGTTIEGVKVLREEKFEEAMIHCVDATVKRSVEMGKE